MTIFSRDGRGLSVWGPTASVTVKVPEMALIDDSWFLSSVSIGAKEIVDVRKCFEDVAYIYALGNDQSRCQMVLSFVVFVKKTCGSPDSSPMKSIDDGLKWYAENRISQKTSPRPITIGAFTRNGWITGVDVGEIDAAAGYGRANISCIMELSK